MSLKDLWSALDNQKQLTGKLQITGDLVRDNFAPSADASAFQELAGKYLGLTQLEIENPSLPRPALSKKGKRTLKKQARSPIPQVDWKAKKILSTHRTILDLRRQHQSTKIRWIRKVLLDPEGIQVLLADQSWILGLLRRPKAIAKVRSRNSKAERSLSESFEIEDPPFLEIRGKVRSEKYLADAEYDVFARFSLESGEPHYQVEVLLGGKTAAAILKRAEIRELDTCKFGDASFILSSHDQPPATILSEGSLGAYDSSFNAGAHLFPLSKGIRFYCRYELGPFLTQSVTETGQMVLIGVLNDDESAPGGIRFLLESMPFSLDFEDVTMREVGLRIYTVLAGDADYHYTKAVLEGVWRKDAFEVPLWSRLPPDHGVICWNTPKPYSLAGKSYEELAPLVWYQSDWFEAFPRLQPLLERADPPHLVGVQLGVDVVNRKTSDVTLKVRAREIKIKDLPDAKLDPVDIQWFINHPADAQRRAILAEVYTDLRIGDLLFKAVLAAPDFVIRATFGDETKGEVLPNVDLQSKLTDQLLKHLAVRRDPRMEEESDMEVEVDQVARPEGQVAFTDLFIALDPFWQTFHATALDEEGNQYEYGLPDE